MFNVNLTSKGPDHVGFNACRSAYVTIWIRVLKEQIFIELTKNFTALYGTGRHNTLFISAGQLTMF
jgi:hypothetical protein